MNMIILDASALIALLKSEPYSEKLKEVLPFSVMSTINVAEVAKYFVEKHNIAISVIKSAIESNLYEVIPFDAEQAYISAELITITKKYGLSIGDRACLALGMTKGYPVYTADKIWANLNIPNLSINIIR